MKPVLDGLSQGIHFFLETCMLKHVFHAMCFPTEEEALGLIGEGILCIVAMVTNMYTSQVVCANTTARTSITSARKCRVFSLEPKEDEE